MQNPTTIPHMYAVGREWKRKIKKGEVDAAAAAAALRDALILSDPSLP